MGLNMSMGRRRRPGKKRKAESQRHERHTDMRLHRPDQPVANLHQNRKAIVRCGPKTEHSYTLKLTRTRPAKERFFITLAEIGTVIIEQTPLPRATEILYFRSFPPIFRQATYIDHLCLLNEES